MDSETTMAGWPGARWTGVPGASLWCRVRARRTGAVLGFVAAAGLLLAGSAPLGAQEPREDFPGEPPQPLPAEDVSFPEVGRDTLDNGLELVVVENHEQPVISARLYVPAGAAADPEGKEGLASLTASVLDKGTGSRSAADIASAVEGLGASLGAGASKDYGFARVTSLTKHFPRVMEIFADVVKNATFPDEEFDTQQRRTVSGLRAQLGQPGVLASRKFSSVVYGEHPYGEDPEPGSVGNIAAEDLRAFHSERWVPEGSLLILAGDIDLAGARRFARRWLGDWEGPAPPAPGMPDPPAREGRRIYLVHRPASVQAVLRVGHLGLERESEDRHAVDVMNRILGGGANARLFLILREEKGWTYGAYSSFSDPRDVGTFSARAEVRTPVADSALAELLDQIRRIREETVSGEELEDARSYLTGHFPLEIETPEEVASRVADALLQGRGVEYLESYRSRVREVDARDVRRVAREYLHSDRAAIVVVGDARELYEKLVPFGPVTLFDEEGEEIQLADLEVRRSGVELSAERIREGTFTYGLMFRGNRAGQLEMTVERLEDGNYRVTESLSGAVGNQTTRYVMTPSLGPVSVTQEGQMGPVSAKMDLDYSGSRVTGTAIVPRQGQGEGGRPEMEEISVDTALAAGTIDQNMAGPAVLAASLAEGAEFRLPSYSPRSGVTALRAEVTGEETVEVAAGTFDVYRIQVRVGQQTLSMLVSRQAPRFLIRQEVAGAPVTLELEEGPGGSEDGSDSP